MGEELVNWCLTLSFGSDEAIGAPIEPRLAFRSSSMLALFEAVAAGVGVGVFTLPWGGRDPRLELLSPVDVLGRRGVWLVAPPAGSSRPEVRVVGDRVAAILRRAGSS